MSGLFRPEIKQDPKAQQLVRGWLEDLRSGEFQQGVGLLRNENNRYCCLGVLCNRVDPNRWILDKDRMREENFYRWGDRDFLVLPESVVRLVHLADENGSYSDWSLVGLNDFGKVTFKVTFAEIANFIESELALVLSD